MWCKIEFDSWHIRYEEVRLKPVGSHSLVLADGLHINQGRDQTGIFMVRRNNESAFSADKAKVRVFYAEVEGNNESVQEALKTMLAMSRPARVISEQRANGSTAVLLQHGDAQVVEEAIDQVEEVETPDEESAAPNTRKARGSGRKTDRNAGLTLVPDLDFRPNGKQALKEFVDEKKPKNDLEAALATVYYMQQIMAWPR